MGEVEKYWQQVTLSNNSLFDEGQYESALHGYMEALQSAEVLNLHIGECIRSEVPFIQLYLISCTNLMYTYIALCRFDDAETMLNRMLYYLLHLLENENMDKYLIQAELKRVTLTYLDFIKNTQNVGQTTETLLFKVKQILKDYELLN